MLTRRIDKPIKLLMNFFSFRFTLKESSMWNQWWIVKHRWALSYFQELSSSYAFGHVFPVYYNDNSPGCCTTTVSVQTSNLALMAFFVLLWLCICISHQLMWSWMQGSCFLSLFIYTRYHLKYGRHHWSFVEIIFCNDTDW